MHESKPYGHLMLNGEPVGDDILARMTGVPMDEVKALMAELRQAGVLRVTGKGVVTSRRMTRDHARAQKGRIAVKKRYPQVSGDVEQSGAPSRLPSRLPSRIPTTQMPEARSQKTESRKEEKETRGGADAPELAFVGKVITLSRPDFDRWRKAYSGFDMMAELTKADDFYAESPPPGGKWFFPVSSWLQRAHKDAAKPDLDADIYRNVL